VMRSAETTTRDVAWSTSGPQNADAGSAHAWLVISKAARLLMHAA
jgi:hypothetical protein